MTFHRVSNGIALTILNPASLRDFIFDCNQGLRMQTKLQYVLYYKEYVILKKNQEKLGFLLISGTTGI